MSVLRPLRAQRWLRHPQIQYAGSSVARHPVAGHTCRAESAYTVTSVIALGGERSLLSLAFAVSTLIRDLVLMTGYVNQSFPHPLTKDQEKMYFERWHTGDRDAYQVLIEHNLRLVVHVAKKFDSSGIDHDDLISIGTVGLIKAVETYQPAKGTKFATYAARCIQNET